MPPKPHPNLNPHPRALRLLRLSLLEGNLPHMRLSQGALLAGAVNVPLLWLVASVMAWLFTSAAMVQVGGCVCGRVQRWGAAGACACGACEFKGRANVPAAVAGGGRDGMAVDQRSHDAGER